MRRNRWNLEITQRDLVATPTCRVGGRLSSLKKCSCLRQPWNQGRGWCCVVLGCYWYFTGFWLSQPQINVKVRKGGELLARESTSYFEEKHWTWNYLGTSGNSHLFNERRIIFYFHWEIVGIQSLELSSKSRFSGLMLLKPLSLYFSVLVRCDSSRSGAAPISTGGLIQIQCHPLKWREEIAIFNTRTGQNFNAFMYEAPFVIAWFCTFFLKRNSYICFCNRRMIKSTN